MKTFSGIKSSDEIKAQCVVYGWSVDTTKYDRGDEYITFPFEHEGTTATVIYSVINGRFQGKLGDGRQFHSDDATLDGMPWFNALLDFVYVAKPAAKAA